MTEAQQRFLKYIRTKMVFTLRYKTDKEGLQPIAIRINDINKMFFPSPMYDSEKEIQQLIDLGELSVFRSGKVHTYEALKPGGFDLNLLPAKPIPENSIIRQMLYNISLVSLPPDAARTPYFDLFLKYKNARPDLFFTVDNFSGRIHTPVSSFQKIYRSNLLLNFQETSSLDVATMQPLILGKILNTVVGDNEYSELINNGEDIYLLIKDKMKLTTRDEAKSKFYKITFGWASESLSEMFGQATWINWINEYKSKPELRNGKPKVLSNGKISYHNNLAWLLQKTEVKIMMKVWAKLVGLEIPFLSVHDEIIIQANRLKEAEKVMKEVLSIDFQYFKICSKS